MPACQGEQEKLSHPTEGVIALQLIVWDALRDAPSGMLRGTSPVSLAELPTSRPWACGSKWTRGPAGPKAGSRSRSAEASMRVPSWQVSAT